MDQKLLLISLIKKFQLEKKRDEATNQIIYRLRGTHAIVTIFMIGFFFSLLKTFLVSKNLEIFVYTAWLGSFSFSLVVNSFFINSSSLKNPRFFCPHGKLGDEIVEIEKEIIRELVGAVKAEGEN